jgi:hypothetical protein
MHVGCPFPAAFPVLTGLALGAKGCPDLAGMLAAMVRIRLCAATVALVGIVVSAEPSAAQFGHLFDGLFGPPPRPPSDVPTPSQPSEPLPPPPEPMDPGLRGPAVIQSEPLAPPSSLNPQAPQTLPAPAAALPSQPAAPLPSQQAPAAALPTQRQPPNAAATVAAVPPTDETITELPSQKIGNPTAVFSGLDKVTGRITSFDVAINETVQFGALQVTPRVCYTRPPTETPNTDAFVEVSEVTLQGEVKRIFGGWMFASSPGLHAVEHPIYDVWLTDCKGGASTVASTSPAATPTTPRATATQNTAAQRQGPTTQQRQPARPAQTRPLPYTVPQ